MPSEAAKNARTCLRKCRSLTVSPSQSLRSWERSISSAVQNDASCFLYISQTSGNWRGNITQRFGFSRKRTSCASKALYSAETRLRVEGAMRNILENSTLIEQEEMHLAMPAK